MELKAIYRVITLIKSIFHNNNTIEVKQSQVKSSASHPLPYGRGLLGGVVKWVYQVFSSWIFRGRSTVGWGNLISPFNPLERM